MSVVVWWMVLVINAALRFERILGVKSIIEFEIPVAAFNPSPQITREIIV
jgi:hypothetical protein